MAEQELTKQIGEKFVFGNNFAPKLPANAALVSGIVLATRKGKSDATTLTLAAAKDDQTLQLGANVQAGAALLLDEGRPTEEPVLVTSVSGTGPYTATLASKLQLDHALGATVKYDLGASALVLASTTATISGTVLGANVIGGLVYEYTITFLATISNGQVIRDDVTLIVND